FLLFLILPPPPTSTLFPYTTLFRSLSIGNAPARLSFRLVVFRLRPLLTCSGRSFSLYDARDARDHKACLLGGGGQLHRKNSYQRDRKSTTSELQSRGHLVCRLLLEK